MIRRKFLASIPQLSAVVAFTPRLLAAASADAPLEIAKLYKNAIVPDLNGPSHMEVIAHGLANRGQPTAVIEKVLGANFQRAVGDIWGTA